MGLPSRRGPDCVGPLFCRECKYVGEVAKTAGRNGLALPTNRTQLCHVCVSLIRAVLLWSGGESNPD